MKTPWHSEEPTWDDGERIGRFEGRNEETRTARTTKLKHVVKYVLRRSIWALSLWTDHYGMSRTLPRTSQDCTHHTDGYTAHNTQCNQE
jgi:hypothetical protein